MKYRLVQKGNPSKPEAPKKWYATTHNEGTISVAEIAKDIASRSSLTRGDVMNVIENLLDEIPEYLKRGNTVSLGDFCSLRLSISGKGSDTEKEYKVENIQKVKVLFTPSTTMKRDMSNIKFERVK